MSHAKTNRFVSAVQNCYETQNFVVGICDNVRFSTRITTFRRSHLSPFPEIDPVDGCNISFETSFVTPWQVNSLNAHSRENLITCREAYFCKYEYNRCSWKVIQLLT